MLDDIRSRALAGQTAATCSEDVLRLCRRVESGEAPAKSYDTLDVGEIIAKVERCTACGSFS